MLKGWKAAAFLTLAFASYTAVDMLGAPLLPILFGGVIVSSIVNFPMLMKLPKVG